MVIAVTLATTGDTTSQERSGSVGFELSLTNSGFGFGGYFRDSLSVHWALILEASIGSGKDEREVAFFNRFGQKSVPGKANYLIVAPVQLGMQRRLFSDAIEDNFRPFFQASIGPTLAWEHPYFFDCNGDGAFDVRIDCNGDGVIGADEGDERLSVYRSLSRGHALLGLGGTISFGSYFGHGKRGARGFRVGYTFNYYPTGTSLLEVDINDPRRYFGTPSVAVFFGKIF
jgi:hypothetical protein